ncbi:roquin-1 isoform X2 [Nematostella vectensis]|uniref:roquin-1 isoform X2 n=1 Tax=Nematostella vectensis TaxID=45351 RepID=UPI0020779A7F|nr:roquin-1 isoform X2 [Nematostella vectensis]
MPIQTPQWTEFLTCPICYHEFEDRQRGPISLACGHTICKACLSQLHKTQCPFDQATVNTDIDKLPVNTALLQLVVLGASVMDYPLPDIPNVRENSSKYQAAMRSIEELAMYLKPVASSQGTSQSSNGTNGLSSSTTLTRPMQRKLVTLVNCQLAEEEGRTRAMRAARSLGERTVTELILLHQNPQQLSANLWAAVRARGCQFLGPAMQEEALKLILLALDGGDPLSRKVLVLYVVQKLEPVYPQASKTSIGHVVQLLYRASCFKVTKRDDESSLMQLKEQFRTYESLRKEHDAQIVQIAMEAGLRISPDQWSSLLYGDLEKKSHMQSIIDKLQSPSSFSQSIQELIISLQRSSDPGDLSRLRVHFERLSEIDTAPDAAPPSWKELEDAMEAVQLVVQGLVSFSKVYGSKMKGSTDPPQPNSNFSKFKTSMCRDYQKPGGCPRGANCSFAHSEGELEKYGGRGQRRPIIKPKATVVARGPSAPDTYLGVEHGSVETQGTQVSQINGGSARSSPCIVRAPGDIPQGGFSQPTYSRPTPDSVNQRMKQMTLSFPEGNYSATPGYERVPYANGSERNGYYNGTYLPPQGVITPRSSPLTVQEDPMNGSRENGLSNGHSDSRRQPMRLSYDSRRYGGYEAYYPDQYGYSQSDIYSAPYSRVAYEQPMPMQYIPTCRQTVDRLDYYPPSIPSLGVLNGFHGEPMMNGVPVNGFSRYREGQLQRRSPFIQSDEVSDSPRSDSDYEEFLRDLRPLRKDTSSSGVSSASPLSHSPAASQSSSSSLSPRQDSPLGWQHPPSESDKIWQNYFSENPVIRPPPGILSDPATQIWRQKQKEVRKLWQTDRNQDQISKDEEYARKLQEAENSDLDRHVTSTIDDMAIVKALTEDDNPRQHLDLDDLAKARREQEEKDCRLAHETQRLEGRHEAILRKKRMFLEQQERKKQEREDKILAQQIAFEDAKKAGLVESSIKPIGYKSSVISGPPSATCPSHGFNDFGGLGYISGCGSPYGGTDVRDSAKMPCSRNGDIFVRE